MKQSEFVLTDDFGIRELCAKIVPKNLFEEKKRVPVLASKRIAVLQQSLFCPISHPVTFFCSLEQNYWSKEPILSEGTRGNVSRSKTAGELNKLERGKYTNREGKDA